MLYASPSLAGGAEILGMLQECETKNTLCDSFPIGPSWTGPPETVS